MIEFPSSPAVGDTYTYNTRTWAWNGDGWERVLNAGQSVSIFVVGIIVNDLQVFAQIPNDWYEVNYV